ncbi:MAG TPA: serine hydrolase [Bacteroidia bacterium]|jgi:CubicO group peptidase (beta-lactamase class C family)|nr:serine hydrolase [Bacteroidia bacterium]
MKTFRKAIRFILYTLFVVVLTVNFVILFTGRFYIYKTLANTVFKGRLSPGIDEYHIFPNRKVNIGKPIPWPMAADYNKKTISDSLLEQMKKYQTIAYVIVKNDSLRYEQYWDGYSDTSHTNSFSMGKSITSILCGIAIAEGKIKSVDEHVSDFLPEYKKGMDSLLTIKDLLEMGSGINFGESYISPFSYPAEAYYSNDIMKYTLKYKVDSMPGQKFKYLSGNTTLLGYCVSKAVGMSLSDYASEKLWQPIGAEQPAYWSIDHEGGLEKAYCCFNSNARDFAKIGELYLNLGSVYRYDSYMDSTGTHQTVSCRGIVPRDWVVASTTPKLCAYYGYQWWIINFEGHIIPYCRGLQGQYIFVIPEQRMVVVRLGAKRGPVVMEQIDGKEYNIPSDALIYLRAAFQMYGK